MSVQLVISTVFPVFIIIFIGFLIGKKHEVNVNPIINFIVYISGPMLILTSLVNAKLQPKDFGIIALAAAIIMLTQLIIFTLILKVFKSKKVGLTLPAVFGNTGFLGFPIALFSFGEFGLSSAIVYDMTMGFFLFSLGIYIVHKRNEIKEVFKMPLIYAMVIGLFLNIFQIQPPKLIFTPIEMIGKITIPIALIILGIRLTKIHLKDLKTSLAVSIYKIIGGLTLAFAVVSLLNVQGTIRNIIILEAAMPSAVMSLVLTYKYQRDADHAASVVLLAQLLSIITIPLILFFLIST